MLPLAVKTRRAQASRPYAVAQAESDESAFFRCERAWRSTDDGRLRSALESLRFRAAEDMRRGAPPVIDLGAVLLHPEQGAATLSASAFSLRSL